MTGVRARRVAILLASLAGLLLEVAYTRVVSYKLFYYFTYLVVGLSLLGIGTGGVIVAVSKQIARTSTERIIAVASFAGAVAIPIGYWVVARVRIDTWAIWDYGTRASATNLGRLGLLCFVVFATFVSLGVIVSVLLGRAGDGVGRLYFADLIGAGVGCVLAIPLIVQLGPPRVIVASAVVFGIIGVLMLPAPRRALLAAAGIGFVVLGAYVVEDSLLPDIYTDAAKPGGPGAEYSEWGPVFRVDVVPAFTFGRPESKLLWHDGAWGSGLHRFDGDLSKQSHYDEGPPSLPFAVLGTPPERELIIGAAGGNEILASLYFGAPDIEAVELNPVTVSLLRDRYADFTGHLPEREEVSLHQGDGRHYLARSDRSYDLVWYVAPDSYAANNAASSGAFVLVESYLYTSEMVEETLEHLTDDGIMVVQFGEIDFGASPNRTNRYVVTARHALEQMGVDDPSRHIAVAALVTEDNGTLSTIIVKRTPFTTEETRRFTERSGILDGVVAVHVPGAPPGNHIVSQLAASTASEVDALVDAYPRDISAVTDNRPFFWHFARFDTVIGDFFEPLGEGSRDPEDQLGERVLLLLLAFATVYAAVFLLLPFVLIRREWRALPRKRASAVYFAGLGLGFMMFEIVMIQRLVRFLAYPSYSLTVTLAAILVFAGLGALVSGRLPFSARAVVASLVGVLALLVLGYQFALDGLLDEFQASALGVRIVVALLVLAPLGLALGMFMPLGLAAVSRSTSHGEQYVAWSWAVNGFFSVIGSVLTTMLSMSFGFSVVQWLALVVYAVAAVAFFRLRPPEPTSSNQMPVDALVGHPRAPADTNGFVVSRRS
jgi:hypothetical protein